MFGSSNVPKNIVLENVSNNVMTADNDGNITYMNKALMEFFRSKEDEIKKVFPNFSVSTLIGTNFDVFHKNPAQQRSMIAALKQPFKTSIHVGEASFDLIATPVVDQSGKRHGTMVEWLDASLRLKAWDYEEQIRAINRSQAFIRFDDQGTIQEANENFQSAVGYRLAEIVGKHHRIFVEENYGRSLEYETFWKRLRGGEFIAGEFERRTKSGEPLWLQASYNPVFDPEGNVSGVVKFAMDITEEKLRGMRRTESQKVIANDLQSVAENVSSASSIATTASQQSETTSSNVQSVSAAVEELAASVGEINRQVSDAREISNEAVGHAQNASTIVLTMSEAASEIENVVNLISDIAEQTNLLALNATIEAARAGEAGRGFGVVAGEVKDLATQTSKATAEIASKIMNVQKTSEDTANVIGSISEIIGRLNEISLAISSAVEEQSVTTSDMASTMQVAAEGVKGIDGSMSEIAQSLTSIADSTEKVRKESAALG